jgi:Mn2+/Fe2+ NRAMP family transporter
VVAVPLIVVILLVANNRSIMGEQTNGWLSNSVSLITTLFMGAAAVATVLTVFRP